jgi:predicted nucleic acid-binding protein
MEYLHPLQRKYEAEIERLTAIVNLSETSARDKANSQKRIETLRKKISECRDYDHIIAHIAVQNIELVLDDGVTANYAKFQGVEIAQGDGRPPVKMDLLGKI